jgi:hypothetical protein
MVGPLQALAQTGVAYAHREILTIPREKRRRDPGDRAR